MLDSGVGFVFIPGLHDLDKHLLRSPWHRGTGHPRLSCPCSARALLHRKQAEAVSAGWEREWGARLSPLPLLRGRGPWEAWMLSTKDVDRPKGR